jgi:hypothetical protein
MTFDDDFIRVCFQTGQRNYVLKSLGLAWPPPELIDIAGFQFKRSSMSSITDEQRAGMTHVCRGAEYVPA